MDKESDEIINKKCAEYKQHELNKKGEQTAEALSKHVINQFSKGISWFVKIRGVKKIRQEIKDDPIIQDQMFNLGCLSVCALADYLASLLVGVHILNNLDLGDEPKNEGYEGKGS